MTYYPPTSMSYPIRMNNPINDNQPLRNVQPFEIISDQVNILQQTLLNQQLNVCSNLVILHHNFKVKIQEIRCRMLQYNQQLLSTIFQLKTNPSNPKFRQEHLYNIVERMQLCKEQQNIYMHLSNLNYEGQFAYLIVKETIEKELNQMEQENPDENNMEIFNLLKLSLVNLYRNSQIFTMFFNSEKNLINEWIEELDKDLIAFNDHLKVFSKI